MSKKRKRAYPYTFAPPVLPPAPKRADGLVPVKLDSIVDALDRVDPRLPTGRRLYL